MTLPVGPVRPAIEPDAIFNTDGELVWSSNAHDDRYRVYYDVHVDGDPTSSFVVDEPTINPWSGTEEIFIGMDPSSPPGSNWGWYRDGAGGTSFRVRGKR